ncbi:mannose-binding protein [Streptomyces sp. NBC_01433]|uniref:mannose-binding protein n=1 Tax=Streptomyces sp. NBC_01433 TaxID=2903864 RepID=UPI0022508E02|nr:mannose-binding protein [Streptomyces sp. NBC_01433]MCX4679469.1 mannose-binding protein [Streptomyces sp. NBC_01433]
MSPQQPTPGANAAAAAAPDVQEAGSPPPSTAPAEEAPGPAAAPGAEPGTTPAAEPAAIPAGKAAATPPPPSAAARTAQPPEEGIGVAAAVGTVPTTRTGTGVNSGRPRRPILAGAAAVGAALIAIPLLLTGSANDEGHHNTAKGRAAEGADTVLNPDSAPAALDDYVAQKPSSSPSKEKPKKIETPKATVPKPVVPTSEPRPSSPPEKKHTTKPKAAPKPNWTTVTVFAPSVLEVNQAWTTNRIRMVMQTDGNLVVLNEQGKPIWASMTFGDNHRAIFQPDGNLVIHNAADRPIWASRTHDHAGAQLMLRADAKVVIMHNGGVIWST